MDWDTQVTLFVCNIAPTLPDSFVVSILQQFGHVLNWKRAKTINDRTLDFGFVDFASPNDALKALRLIPYVKVLDLSWTAKLDRSQELNLQAFQTAKNLRLGFNQNQEIREDQLTMKVINELISSATFAKANERMVGIIESEFDEKRESEHFRYQTEVRKEDEQFDSLFKEALMVQKGIEISREAQLKSMEQAKFESQARIDRKNFLRNWKRPMLESNDIESLTKFAQIWTQFNNYRKERTTMRENEREYENLLE
ncbi:hypothetical protein TVAG_111420 [Trichomonas vaginalis G3]|uniref:RRM domain-containing protein n=1 Tax=Trichomonas vaginalis (strain ATCC PRA-98 / G3) TaxID=412133 RepID=A2F001_TRIV3|nr:RBM25 protein family [Trichomonas vaginalis G3]EAY01785.1 hypothetical protein TVAG_111420 [Trichomonas vaginalis G3]KAI5546833.1 RBM25 protein family [Trichomonas vaginalis G3]|eukprot:XP_001314343.1 hypothetical protein [Trichomonas vaginalis G3]